ncbi:MAG: hypothetical protein N3D11_08985 [Candidatus Sumerlaeia bacterium]|nr:hypothetical protein [Candidatus Sumerlaeia bacterium]
MKKRTALFAGVALLAAAAHAGPQILTYQGSVTAAGGAAVTDGTYRMRFSMLDAETSPAGVVRWTETDTAVQVTGGLFSTVLGDGTAFGTLFQDHSNLWLEVAIDLNKNGTFEPNEIYAPRQRVTAAAWAIEADRLQGRAAADFAPAVHIHPGTGDITGVLAAQGLSGGGLAGDVVLGVTTGGITSELLGNRAVTEEKSALFTAGSGKSTTWASMAKQTIKQNNNASFARALFIMNGEDIGGAGQVRVMRNKFQITSFTVTAGGAHPQVYISEKFNIVNNDVVFLQYRANSALDPMIWRHVGLIFSTTGDYVQVSGDTMTGALSFSGTSGATRINLTNGDIINADDLIFAAGGGGKIDLNSGILDDATTISGQYHRYRSARTFYKNFSCHEMVSAVDDADSIRREAGAGYAYIVGGTAPYSAGMRVGVHLPQGARMTQFLAWVWDNDSGGLIAVELCYGTNTGVPVVISNIETTVSSAIPSIQQLTGSTITAPVVDNLNNVYFINVYMQPSGIGFSYMRFYSARLYYTMTDIAD